MCPEGPFNFIGYDSWWKKAKKVMDSTRHLGTKHLRGLQNLTRLMAHHGQGSKPCPLCHGCSSYSSTDRTCIDLTSHACSDFGLSCISADKLLTLQLWLDNFNPYCVATTLPLLVSLVGPLVWNFEFWTLNFEFWASSPTLRDCSSVCCSHVFCGLSQKLLLKEVLTPTFCLVPNFK